MWWKIVLLTFYLSVLFVLSRILEAFAYYEGGYLASRLLDPVSLSMRKLKAILDQRGVSYTGVIEKQELTELVTTSGGVTNGELEVGVLALADETAEVVSTNFTCGTHFYEEVEDTKDSVWVVQVVSERHGLFMQHGNWKTFVKKVSRFGVRTGIFDCTLDRSLCDKKKWYRSQLVLAMPQGYRAKDHVTLRNYSKSSKHQAVLDWVNVNLASRISEVNSLDELQERWFHFKKKHDSNRIRVLLFSKMTIPPMFYSVLSVKFTGRVKFGIVNFESTEGRKIASHLNLSDVPTYVVLTPEKNRTFGQGNGEYLNYQSMGLLLRTLHPEVNDIFLLSLIVINMACWLEFFVARGNLFKRLGRVLWDIVKWNFLLILLWLPVLGLFQLPYMDAIFAHLLTALRIVGMTNFAGYIRSDWLWYSSVGWVFFVATFLLFSCGVAFLHYVYQGHEQEQQRPSLENISGFWNFQWESYMSSFFQPMSNIARPVNVHAYGMEVGMELLIERLAVPNLWLRPMISSQYIHNLPVWKYQGPCTDSDIGSDSECLSTRAESDCEESAASGSDAASAAVGIQRELGPRPLMFICERCRLLQNNNANGKSEQELEEERLESESACAKYLMDGDYKCMCGQQGSGHGHQQSEPKNLQKDRSRTSKAKPVDQHHQHEAGQSVDSGHQMPSGIIATMECSICLDSYKYDAVLCGLPCGHAFHQQCIMGWLNRDNHCCPICRWPAYKAKPCNAHQHAD